MLRSTQGQRLRRAVLGAAAAAALFGLAACGGQGGGSPSPGASAAASCPAGAALPSGTVQARGDRAAQGGLDVTAVASLDPNYGVNGTVDVTVTVSCPTDISDVAVFQSYQAFGSTVGANLSEVGHSGDRWTFALYADNLSGQQPFYVALYRGALSGSGQPAAATVRFTWPAGLVKHLAS